MKKMGMVARISLFLMFIFVSLCVCWSAAFWLTGFFYSRFGEHPNDFLQQLINSALGFFLFGFMMFLVSRVFNPKRQQLDFFKSLNQALIQMAKGDFDVNVTLPSRHDTAPGNPFGEMADTIHHVAGELNEMEKMRKEFVSNVSHEIQSPLTSIRGFARALQNDAIGKKERMHYLKIIETESKRLSKLSDNLLKLTSLESEHHPFERKPYRLDHQLRKVVLSCEPQWEDKSIEMNVFLQPVTITADRDLLDQVWLNLLGNAIKFTPQGGKIEIHLDQEGEDSIVAISDNGIGMTGEEQSHLFERFYKADASRERTNEGNGLGLSIVKKIIDMHGGSIEVQSRKNEGSVFRVCLREAVEPH